GQSEYGPERARPLRRSVSRKDGKFGGGQQRRNPSGRGQAKATPMGYAGSDRTLRRAIAEAKALYRAGHRRRFRPWLPEPGLWFQWDYADGPLVQGRKTCLWCAWLAWSRFRVVLPIRDKTLPTVIACIDATLRRFGGAPTYGLSDNEKTLTLDHIARIAVRH